MLSYVSNYYPTLGSVLPVLIWPNPILAEPSQPITDFDSSIRQLTMDMAKTMQHYNGIGLAAPQIGKNLRAIVIEADDCPIVLINPTITSINETYNYATDEGCLSVPGYYEKRSRPQQVRVQYQNVNGGLHENEFYGLMAFAVQHEIDHLDGKLFIDNLSPLKLGRVKNKIKKTVRHS